MLAIYDLSKSPVTYDFVHWLANVERQRLAKGEKEVTVRFVLGDRQVTERDQHFTPERKAWRLHNLLVPLCRLLPAVTKYEIGTDGWQDIPYKPEVPVAGGEILKSSEAAQSVISAWLRQDKPVVTITIRQSDLQTSRNSNFAEWMKVAAWLREKGVLPVFIPDTEATMVGEAPRIQHFRTCVPAAMSVDLRLALYERAVLNCFTSGGPFGLALYSGAPFLLCKTVVPEIRSCSEETQKKLGYTPEAFSGPYQRIFWCEDTFEELKPKLEEMLPACLERPRELPKLYAFAVQKPKRLENIAETAKRGLPVLGQVPPHDRIAVLACYGPSLKETWRHIPQSGADVFTVSGAHQFLLERNIVPSGHIETDPRAHKAEFTKNADPRVTYYLASCCDPLVFENAKNCPTKVWHSYDGDEIEREVLKHWPDAFLLMGGSNVGLRAIAVLSVLGYRKFAIFGMDCSVVDGERHAGPHGGKTQKHMSVTPVGSEREFVTTPQMISGAREFLNLAAVLTAQGYQFDVYGDGLLPEMLKIAMQPAQERELRNVA